MNWSRKWPSPHICVHFKCRIMIVILIFGIKSFFWKKKATATITKIIWNIRCGMESVQSVCIHRTFFLVMGPSNHSKIELSEYFQICAELQNEGKWEIAKLKTLCAAVCGHAFIIDCIKLRSFWHEHWASIVNDADYSNDVVVDDGKCLEAMWVAARIAIVMWSGYSMLSAKELVWCVYV